MKISDSIDHHVDSTIDLFKRPALNTQRLDAITDVAKTIPPNIPTPVAVTGIAKALDDREQNQKKQAYVNPNNPVSIPLQNIPFSQLSPMQQYHRGQRSLQSIDPSIDVIQPVAPEADLIGVGKLLKPLSSIAKDAASIYKANKKLKPGEPLPDWSKVKIGSEIDKTAQLPGKDPWAGVKPLSQSELEILKQKRRDADLRAAEIKFQEYMDKAVQRAQATAVQDLILNRSKEYDSK